MPFVFFHGGPNFNNYAEERILGPLLASTGESSIFWDENLDAPPRGPSRFTELHRYVEAFLERHRPLGPLHVVAHSFSAQMLLRVAVRPELMATLTLITPMVDEVRCMQDILRIATSDFEKIGEDRSVMAIQVGIASSSEFFDEAMQSAFITAANDPILFSNYWCNLEMMERFMAIWREKRVSIDMTAVLAAWLDLSRQPRLGPNAPVGVPTQVVWGERDPVIRREVHREPLQALCPGLIERVLPGTCHFPHLEAAKPFAAALTEFARSRK